MNTSAATVAVFLVACAASGLLTLVVCRAAPRFGLIDDPDSYRKTHRRPIPLGGGLAVYLATAGLLAALLAVPNPFRADLRDSWPDLVTLLLAGAVIVTVGLVDDRVPLRGRQKLLGQALAASIVMSGGLVIQHIAIFGWQIDLGLLSLPFTIFWLLGAVNALNLLDGIDGLASTIGLILVSAIAGMAVLVGHHYVAVVALVFAGGLLGFLRFNFPPARIFLGDAGSMLIGLVVGTLAIQGSLKGPGTVLLAAPLALWTIPVFDSAAAILRRTLTGRSIYAVDHGHLHHRLLGRLGSHFRVLALVGLTCALTSAAALMSVVLKSDLVAIVTCGAIVMLFAITGLFGRMEFLLLARRLRKVGGSLLPQVLPRKAAASNGIIRIRGSQEWELLWENITETADQLSLRRVCLDVNMPTAHEEFNAIWDTAPGDDLARCWQIQVPLVVADRSVGSLAVAGERNGVSASEDIKRLFGMLELVETQMLHLAGQQTPTLARAAPLATVEPDDDQSTPVLSRKYPK